MAAWLRVRACVWLASAVLILHIHAQAAQPMLPLLGGGAKVTIDFADQQMSKVVFIGALPGMPGVNLMGMTVSLNVGGVQRTYTLSPEGEGVATPDLFQLRDNGNGTGYTFILSTFDNSLANAYQALGFINNNLMNAPVSMPVQISFNGMLFGTTLTGFYNSKVDTVGKGFLGVIRAPTDPFAIVTHITTLKASPNPTQAGQAVTIKGAVSLKNFTGAVAGNLHFGDQTAPIHADGATFQQMLKSGISHTYTAEGVYVARVTLIGGDELADTRLFVIVGDNFVVNSQNGAVGRLVKGPSGGVQLQVGLSNVPGAMTAQTNFLDMKGNTAGLPPYTQPPGGQMGLAPSNTFVMPGIYVAESMALDGNGKPLGMLRKSIAISSADIGNSDTASAVNAGKQALSDKQASATTTDSTITLTSMSGKFLFTSTQADTVIFNGTVVLPAGFTPKAAAGNDITFAMGNVSDTVHLSSKNTLTLPTALGYITKFKMIVPKLTNGVAVGTETAKVSLTMSTGDLDVKGFDSEGISVSLRSDEVGQSSVARFVQLDMLLGGKSYSNLIQVSYATTANSDLGTISGRSSK